MSSTTVCMTDTSVIPFPTLEPTYTQTSNTAASPLPHVPCRNTRPSVVFTLSDTSLSDSNTPYSSDSVDYSLQSRSATHVRHDSQSSSSSSTPSDDVRPTIILRSKRVVSQHSPTIDSRDIFAPVPASTPLKPPVDGSPFLGIESRKQTPLRDASDADSDEDALPPFPVLKRSPFCKVGKLRLEGAISKEARHMYDPTPAPVSGTPNVKQSSQTIRKKSGQPVKSSLKSARRPELHVVTDGAFAKSEPATPTHTKAVHFDSKLEHIKLFLAEQKPLAVSRDGSPTSDTSGDEFPSFIYGNNTRENKQVKMLVPNIPSSLRKDDNVALQDMVLSQDQRIITGSIRVRNIAYEKWLAVRFTLDWWQTTSEVTARYEKSIDGGVFDVFTFTIRLSDIWLRIEEKTIFLALRYNVAGREFWDNNAGQNYHIKFVLARPLETPSAVDNETSLKDLDSRLENLARTRSAPIPISPYRLGRSFSADHQYSSFAKPSSSRYDFVHAYKTQVTKSAPSQSSRHTRTHTYPSGVPSTAGPTVAPWSGATKASETEQAIPPRPQPASPQEAEDGSPIPPARPETKLSLPGSPNQSHLLDGRGRNHRRGYSDKVMDESPTLRRTPPGSPLKFDVLGKDPAVLLPRTHSYPFVAPKNVSLPSTSKPPLSIRIAPFDEGGSEESTPYETSQTSSSTPDTCSGTPLFSPVSVGAGGDTSYKQLLDQFCFFTGTGASLQESSETLPRSHSASSIDRYLLSNSPPQSFSSHTPPAMRV